METKQKGQCKGLNKCVLMCQGYPNGWKWSGDTRTKFGYVLEVFLEFKAQNGINEEK